MSALPVLFLAGCGEGGWEMVPYTQVPYTLERTAGTGVAYVRAHMLPQKGPSLEPALPMSEPPAVVAPEPSPAPVPEAAPAPAPAAEKMFKDLMKK